MPVIDLATTPLRELNQALHDAAAPGHNDTEFEVLNPKGAHAVAVGVAAVFMETHEDPDTAPSDGPNMIHLTDMPAVLETLAAFDRLAKAHPVSL